MSRPEPYVKRDAGDAIRSGDWNELQIKAREEVQGHRHTGNGDGLKIPRNGIEPKAIDGGLIDPAADVTLNSLTIDKELRVNGKAILNDIDDLYTNFKRLESDKMNRAGDTITGPLNLENNMFVAGNVGIGTTTHEAKLDVNGNIHATPVMGTWYPGSHGPGIETPTDKLLFVVFDQEDNISDSTCFTNLGGSNGIRVEKEGYYYLQASILFSIEDALDWGNMHLHINDPVKDWELFNGNQGIGHRRHHFNWKGPIQKGDVIRVSTSHAKPTSCWYYAGSAATRLTIHKIN